MMGSIKKRVHTCRLIEKMNCNLSFVVDVKIENKSIFPGFSTALYSPAKLSSTIEKKEKTKEEVS